MKQRGLKCRLLALCLAIALVLPLIPAQALAAETDTIEKVYCTATLEDSFTDNEVLLVMMPEYNETVYVISDFSDVDCTALEELSYDTEPGVLSRIFLLTLAEHSKQNVLDAIDILQQREDIYSAEPNVSFELNEVPSDPYYLNGYQWGIDKINLPAAWDICSEAPSVYVGVIDTGIDGTHSDLFINIDQSLSKNFVDSTSPLTDTLGHGTKVAGIIGANGNNYEGISGVCWVVKLVSLKVFKTSLTEFNTSAIVEAVTYAGKKGIKILNCSIGTETDSAPSLRVALSTYNGLFICSAGNLYRNTDEVLHYPSYFNSLDNVISVGASTSADQKYWSSNYGKTTVDVFAPGENIYTCISGGGYAYASGTSMAAPFVTGVAALLLSKNSSMSPSKIKEQILDNVDEISYLTDLCTSKGRLNAYKALVG